MKSLSKLGVAVVLLMFSASLGWAGAFQIDTNFPSGNIVVEKIDGNIVTVHQDRRDTREFWFYWCFRVRGAEGRTLTFNFTDGAPIGVRGPAVSLDEGVTWNWLGAQTNNSSFSYSFPKDAVSVRFSFGMPYTEANLKSFLAKLGKSQAIKQETLCSSRKGRAVERLHVGQLNGNPAHRVFLTCRAHCCEMMTSYVAEGVIESVLGRDDDGKWFRENVELLVVPFVDKDGVEDGDQGKNRHPRDHNRDFDAKSLYPETRAIQEFVPRWSNNKVRLAIDLHCPAIRGEYNEVIYIVGSQDAKNYEQQKRFGELLEQVKTGPLPYLASDTLPYGEKWNTGKNFVLGTSAAKWSGTLPGINLATTIEFPYANVSGKEVNATTARAFGHDLTKAIRRYLESIQK